MTSSKLLGSLVRNVMYPGTRNKIGSKWTTLITPSRSRGQGMDLQPRRTFASIYEPEYLDAVAVEIPSYDLLNLQIKGYDFPVLEKYSKYVHHTAERFGINVEEAWPQPCKKLKVTKLKPESTAVDSEYLLNLYERNVQIADVPSTLLPILVNVIEAALPAGVTLRIHPHLPEDTENRYVPDLELKKLKSELDEMRGDKEKDKK